MSRVGAPAGVPFRRKGESFTQDSALLELTPGRRLRALRLAAGLTVDAVADRIGCSRITVLQIECNKRPSSAKIASLCHLYDVTVDDVVRPNVGIVRKENGEHDWKGWKLPAVLNHVRTDMLYELRELAELAGIPYMKLWRIEKGRSKPDEDEIAGLSRATGITADTLRRLSGE